MHAIQHLTPTQLSDLELELIAERVRLERSMAATAAANGVGAAASVMPGGDDGDVALRLRVRERHVAVSDALRRLAGGAFGLCTGCQEAIPYGRLLVMPESERCVACGSTA